MTLIQDVLLFYQTPRLVFGQTNQKKLLSSQTVENSYFYYGQKSNQL